MKASFHLLYGIIIGMLIIACTGSDSDVETASATNTASNEENVASATNTASNPSNSSRITNTITPTANPAPTKKEVKVMFASDGNFDEKTLLYKNALWWKTSDRNYSSSLVNMYASGWRGSEVVKTNASAETFQLLVFFEREVKG